MSRTQSQQRLGRARPSKRLLCLLSAPHLASALCLGLITTIGIAWYSAWRIDLWSAPRVWSVSAKELPVWKFAWLSTRTGSGVLSSVWPENSSLSNLSVVHGPYWSRVQTSPGQKDTSRVGSALYEEARGWPLRCLKSEQHGDTSFVQWQTRYGLPLPLTQGIYKIPRALPLYPIWRGFVADLLFHATWWFSTITLARFARAQWRIRHGRCPHCAHILLADQSRCPECGSPFSRMLPRLGGSGLPKRFLRLHAKYHVTLAILIGLITNVAVAWIVAAQTRPWHSLVLGGSNRSYLHSSIRDAVRGDSQHVRHPLGNSCIIQTAAPPQCGVLSPV